MDNAKQDQHEKGRRIVADGVGNRLELILERKTLSIVDLAHAEKKIDFTLQEVEIIHAFLSVALLMPRDSGRSERLDKGREISLVDRVNPRIRISDEAVSLDIHPASWELIMCEIALMMPRMRD